MFQNYVLRWGRHILQIRAVGMCINFCQRTSIADGDGVEKRPPGNRSSLFIQRLKIYSNVQKTSFRLNES